LANHKSKRRSMDSESIDALDDHPVAMQDGTDAHPRETYEPDDELRREMPRHPLHVGSKVWKQWLGRIKTAVMREHPDLSPGEAIAIAENCLRQNNRGYQRLKKRLMHKALPARATEETSGTCESVELAAIVRIREVAWLYLYPLLRHGEGRPGVRSIVAAVLLYCAFAKVRPDAAAARSKFFEGTEQLGYVFGYPVTHVRDDDGKVREALGLRAHHLSQEAIVQRNNPALTIHANISLLRRMAQATTASGGPLYARLAVDCAIDGMFVEADAPQRRLSEKEMARVHRRGLRRRVAFVIHRARRQTASGQQRHAKVKNKVTGYLLIYIMCIKWRVPLVWILVPASDKEHTAVPRLIDTLYYLWPKCPITTLVGDSAYDVRKTCHWLQFNAGIRPVFVPHGTYSKELKFCDGTTGDLGVPICKEHGPMRRIDAPNDLAAQRLKLVAEGVEFPLAKPRNLNTRIRFKCRACERTETTYPADDARVYTVLPRLGAGPAVDRRYALLDLRAHIESSNGLIRHRGAAGVTVERARKASDARMDWLLGLALLWVTCRRHVHDSGAYAKQKEEMQRLGFRSGFDYRGRVQADEPIDDIVRARAKRDLVDAAKPPMTITTRDYGYSSDTKNNWLDDPSEAGLAA
jgi:hypothetical protein